jgi:coatomer protein complex subunit gamma
MIMQPDIDDCGLEQVASISAPKLEYSVTGVLYLAFQKLTADDFPIGKLDFEVT